MTSWICPGLKNPKMSPYANRNSIAIHSAEILNRTPTLTSSSNIEPCDDTSSPPRFPTSWLQRSPPGCAIAGLVLGWPYVG